MEDKAFKILMEDYRAISSEFPELEIYYEWSEKYNGHITHFICDNESLNGQLGSRLDKFTSKMFRLFPDDTPLFSINNNAFILTNKAKKYSLINDSLIEA